MNEKRQNTLVSGRLRGDEILIALNTLILQGRRVDNVIRVCDFDENGRAVYIVLYTESISESIARGIDLDLHKDDDNG
jgi:hypothetical protein